MCVSARVFFSIPSTLPSFFHPSTPSANYLSLSLSLCLRCNPATLPRQAPIIPTTQTPEASGVPRLLLHNNSSFCRQQGEKIGRDFKPVSVGEKKKRERKTKTALLVLTLPTLLRLCFVQRMLCTKLGITGKIQSLCSIKSAAARRRKGVATLIYHKLSP